MGTRTMLLHFFRRKPRVEGVAGSAIKNKKKSGGEHFGAFRGSIHTELHSITEVIHQVLPHGSRTPQVRP